MTPKQEFVSNFAVTAAFLWCASLGVFVMPSAMADTGLIFTSSNSTSLSNIPDSTSVSVSPSALSANSGTSSTLTATVSDLSNSANSPTGSISWSDNNAGGSFNPPSCTLASNSCTTSYTSSSNSPSTVTITANYGGDVTHSQSAGTATLTINRLDPTSTAIQPTSGTLPSNDTISFSVQVTDTSNSQSFLSGTILLNDNNAGGSFNPPSCAMPVQKCVSTYTAPVNPANTITVNATYSGDNAHSASFAISRISTNTLDTTITTLSPDHARYVQGNSNVFTAAVTDASNPSASMIGIISWSDNGAGGIFNPNNCILSNNKCAITYTPPSNFGNSVTITATYAGDSVHSGSSGTASLSSTTSAPTSPQPSTATTVSPSTSTVPNTSSTPAPSTSNTPSTSNEQSTSSQSAPPQQSAKPAPVTQTPGTQNPTLPSGTAAPSSNPAVTQPQVPASAPEQTTIKNPAGIQSNSKSPSGPSGTESSDHSVSSQPESSADSGPSKIVNGVVSAPESILDKIITLIENVFKKI